MKDVTLIIDCKLLECLDSPMETIERLLIIIMKSGYTNNVLCHKRFTNDYYNSIDARILI